MRHFSKDWTVENMAGWLKRQASIRVFGKSYGEAILDRRAMDSCRCLHIPTGTQAILTRDAGCHSCGWWKNPDYERCLHLSLSFNDPETGESRPKDKKITREWVEAVFGETKNLIWSEPPYSPEGKKRDVWHYRVFYAPDWAAPILPRGEVYSKEFTEAGWISFSDLQAKEQAQEAAALEQLMNGTLKL